LSLKEYEQKRKFENTPEPRGESAAAAPGNRFFVQRHDATRLHYDFRLEMDGVLKSWAVPKGPSLEPLSKNLAMMVEDHPLDYGNFEGNIPKGNYGAGSVMLWDHGTYDLIGDDPPAAQIARGDLKFRLHGEKLKGTFAIVLMKGRGKGNEWLIIKKRDEDAVEKWDIEEYARSVLTGRTQDEIAANLAPAKKPKKAKAGGPPADGAVEAPMPQDVTPMAAVLARHAPVGPGWVYEIKWDGVRALCYVENGKVRMVSRRGNAIDRQYPELSVLPHYLKAKTAIVDAEIAVLDKEGRSSFGLIQPRISVADPNTIAHLVRSTPVHLFAFDLLYLDGYDLRGVKLTERKRLLVGILKPHDHIHLSDHFETGGAEMLEAARQHNLEGIMAKRADSKYEPRRSDCWVKIKITNQQELVIAGFAHGERKYFGSLVLGIHRNGRLEYAGNVGTGFDDKTIEAIYHRLEPLITDVMPLPEKPDIGRKITWVKPQLVAEIKFGEWTKDGRLRAPVFVGLRTDVDPDEVTVESEQEPVGPMLAPTEKEATREVDGQRLKFTNLDKVFYPEQGYTKRDILNYYDAVASLLVPHLAGRPLSLKRYPNGIHEPYFFQKNTPEHYPDWLRIEPIEDIHYVVADNRATLLYLTNLGCIDQNTWMSRIGTLEKPDFLLVDLDPTEGAPYDLLVEAALLVKAKLDQLGLAGYPKTTGGDGLHVYVPLEPVYTYEQVRSFAEVLFHLVFADSPDLFTTPRTVSKRRKGRVYFDYLQISTSKTIAAPYVLRAYEGAPVATPLKWDEVRKGLSPKQFHLGNAMERFTRTGDLFRGVLDKPQRLDEAIGRVTKLVERKP
jgi:bifunctional non-homologous end joining protein LigD